MAPDPAWTVACVLMVQAAIIVVLGGAIIAMGLRD